MLHRQTDLDLNEFVAQGLRELEAWLLKHALFEDYCTLRASPARPREGELDSTYARTVHHRTA